MEVYIDDMLVKSKQAGDHIQHLSDTFQILRKFNMKLNPEKCAFGVSSGLGIVQMPPAGETIRQAIKCHPITNNEAEYEVVIAGLELARVLGIEQIPRDENAEANALANLASAAEVTNKDNASYGTLPEDKKKAQAFRRKAARYCLNWCNLYQKLFGGLLARCLGPSRTEYVMREIHEGHCGNHAGGRSLVPSNRYEKKRSEASFGEISFAEDSKGKWPEVLPGVLWAYQTTTKISMGEIPFSLVYGAEALISVEIGKPSTRYVQGTEESNEEEMRKNLDLLEERRETTLIRMAAQK
uniref:Uncharacterized protein LOC104217329 n=1 Tax=Nicotiana sylvestris TaxID=4096 RepID=A0A1U7VTW7_NICSY|nr:PREDICTED: uncharacterized protein LOC104217329 [Nicotiana sylvestris]